jgi:hypothetical protein
MKKTFTSVVAVSIMSSVSFAQDAPKAPQTQPKTTTRSASPVKQTMVPIPAKQDNAKPAASTTTTVNQKAVNTHKIVNAKPGANNSTAAPKPATTDGTVKRSRDANAK